jgi:hypothetical protein
MRTRAAIAFQEVTMRQQRLLPKAALLCGAICLGTTWAPKPAMAQFPDCPVGYYYFQGYGCAPLSFYTQPYLAPGFGFGFFYGGRGYRGGSFHRAPSHGGAFHGEHHR